MFNTLTTGWSFAMLTLISFDRARALANPMAYHANVSKEGMLVTNRLLLAAILTGKEHVPLEISC